LDETSKSTDAAMHYRRVYIGIVVRISETPRGLETHSRTKSPISSVRDNIYTIFVNLLLRILRNHRPHVIVSTRHDIRDNIYFERENISN